jgi:hypothetical protein
MNLEVNSGYEDGELYRFKKGRFEHVHREEDEGMRRIRITEEAYRKALDIGKSLKRELGGYKPDVALVISALLIHGITDEEQAKRHVRRFVLALFDKPAEVDGTGSQDAELRKGQ